MKVDVVCDTLQGSEILAKSIPWVSAIPLILRNKKDNNCRSIIKVFSDDSLALIIHSEALSCNRVEDYSRLGAAMKHFSLNESAGVMCPTVEIK